MNEKNIIVKYALILAAYTALAGGILALTFSITEPKRLDLAKQNEVIAQQELLPQAVKFERQDKGDFYYYKAFNDDGSLAGYIILTKGKGYSSTLEIMVSLDKELKIVGLKILAQAETPGLGTRITESSFLQQFFGRTGKSIGLKKDSGEIDAITGATISSRAVTNTIAKGIEELKKVLDEEKKNG